MLVLARGLEGYRRLCRVISRAQLVGGEKGRPVYDETACRPPTRICSPLVAICQVSCHGLEDSRSRSPMRRTGTRTARHPTRQVVLQPLLAAASMPSRSRGTCLGLRDAERRREIAWGAASAGTPGPTVLAGDLEARQESRAAEPREMRETAP